MATPAKRKRTLLDVQAEKEDATPKKQRKLRVWKSEEMVMKIRKASFKDWTDEDMYRFNEDFKCSAWDYLLQEWRDEKKGIKTIVRGACYYNSIKSAFKAKDTPQEKLNAMLTEDVSIDEELIEAIGPAQDHVPIYDLMLSYLKTSTKIPSKDEIAGAHSTLKLN